MVFSKELSRFVICEAANHQVEIILLTEILRDNFTSSINRLVHEKLFRSYDNKTLKSTFDSDKEFQNFRRQKTVNTIKSFDKAIWSSMLAYSFFNLERDLNVLCKKFEPEIKSSLRLKNLNGKGIHRSKLFLLKLAGIDFQLLNNHWEFILLCQELRNCITHNGGDITNSRERQSILDFCEQYKGIEITDNFISTSPSFLIIACDKFYDFWLSVALQISPESDKFA